MAGYITIRLLPWISFRENDESFANRSGQKPEIIINNIYGDIYLK